MGSRMSSGGRLALAAAIASALVGCSGGSSGTHTGSPTASPPSSSPSAFPVPGTYVTVSATAAERLLVLGSSTIGGVTGTLVVRQSGSAGTTNLAFIGKLVDGKPVFSFATGNAAVVLTADGFSLAQCDRWVPGATTVADCTFRRSGN